MLAAPNVSAATRVLSYAAHYQRNLNLFRTNSILNRNILTWAGQGFYGQKQSDYKKIGQLYANVTKLSSTYMCQLFH